MKSLDADKKASKTSEAAPAEAEKTVEKIDFSKVKVEPLFEEMVDFDTFSKSDFRAVKVKACEAVKKSKKLLQFTLDDGTGTDRTILSGIHAYYEPEELVGKTLIAITNLPPRAMMGIESSLMPPNEGKILLALLKKSPNLVTKHELCNVLWGTEECIDENALQVTFTRLRKTLREFGLEERIETVRGQGYRLKEQVRL